VPDPLIRVEGLYKIYGPNPQRVLPQVREGRSKEDILAETGHVVGLKDINLEIEKGKIFVIMGLSGSGKSTLIRHFNRLIEPTAGRILIEDTDVMQLSDSELQDYRRHKMSMVFQRFGLMPHRTVIRNVAYGLAVQGIPKSEQAEEAVRWLQAVGLGGYEDQYPAQLSGGEQQRVGLARALATNADILLMDEAFSALDPLIRNEMQDQLVELQETLQKTIIFITHDLDEALRLGDRIAILKDGELIQIGDTTEILLEPNDDYVEAFVRGVNRGRALTVETVMRPPQCCITSDDIAATVKQMRQADARFGFYIADGAFEGVVARGDLEAAADVEGASIADHAIGDVTVLRPGARLEEVLADVVAADHPLPVIGESGELVGELSQKAVLDVLGAGAEGAECETASQIAG
jgi:glycine betaine/proline transport system ATP-binding protein